MKNKFFGAVFACVSLLILSVALSAAQDSEATVETIVPSVGLRGASNGIYFDKYDFLYIASVVNSTITVIDPANGDTLKVYDREDGVVSPDDLYITDDGTIYWTGFLTGELGKINPDGTVEIVQQVAPGLNPITMSDDGRLFSSLCFLGDSVYELDPTGATEPRVIAEGLGGCGINGMDWGSDGLLYGPRWFFGSVVSFNVDTGEMTTVAEGLGVPAAVKFDSQGRLYVLDDMLHSVIRIDVATGEQEVITDAIYSGDNLAFDSQDHLYVSSYATGAIYEVLEGGELRTVVEGGLVAAGGLALRGDSLFVASLFTMAELNPETGETLNAVYDIVGFGPLGDAFALSANGDELVISGWFGNNLLEWNPDTNEIRGPYAGFAAPINAVAFQGDLIVANLGTGSFVRASGEDRSEITLVMGDVTVPAGIAASDDDLWVSDWATGTIWQVVADGETLAEPLEVVTGLQFPEGMALAPDGRLLVVETGTHSLVAVDLATGTVSTIAADLEVGLASPVSTMPPTWLFNGVAVAEDGTIYVSSDMANTVYRIRE